MEGGNLKSRRRLADQDSEEDSRRRTESLEGDENHMIKSEGLQPSKDLPPTCEEWSDHFDIEPFVYKDASHLVIPKGVDPEEDQICSDDEEILEREISHSKWDSSSTANGLKRELFSYGRVVTRMFHGRSKVTRPQPTCDNVNDGETQISTSVYLPVEIMTIILSKLPYRRFSRLRSVCKEWNALPQDREFVKSCAKPVGEAPYAVLFDHHIQGYSTFNPESHAWSHLPRSFFSFSASKFCLLASAGGLLLFEGVGFYERTFFVVNPINKSERRLPALEGKRVAGKVYYSNITMDAGTDEFKILIVDCFDFNCAWRFQIYDSHTHCWELLGRLPNYLQFADFRGVVLYEGSLHCLAILETSNRIFRISRQSCNGEEKLDRRGKPMFWHSTGIQVPNKEFLFLEFFEHGGNLLLGGRQDYWADDLSLHFWRYELVGSKMVWVEVQRLPKKLRNKLSHLEIDTQVICEGDYIWASSAIRNFKLRYPSIEGSAMVMGNIVKKTWCVVPRYPFGCPRHCNRVCCGEDMERRTCTLFLFQPRLDLLL